MFRLLSPPLSPLDIQFLYKKNDYDPEKESKFSLYLHELNTSMEDEMKKWLSLQCSFSFDQYKQYIVWKMNTEKEYCKRIKEERASIRMGDKNWRRWIFIGLFILSLFLLFGVYIKW